MSDFRKDLAAVLNCYSKEQGSNTPDFILADYLTACLYAFDDAMAKRKNWYSTPPDPPEEE